jgi:hypothetical protein
MLIVAGPALADPPIATARGDAPAQAPADTPPLDAQGQTADDAPQARLGPCGPQTIGADGKPDTRARGEVDVGVGTHGYRRVALHACKPIGDAGAVAISISQTQAGGWPQRR